MDFAIIWEFRVRSGMEQLFEAAYGADGDWVKLFCKSPEYVRTELIRDVNDRGRYLTIDVWKSNAAYEAFREGYRQAYKKIDGLCAEVTEAERELGKFVGVWG
jgi:heme-degrading monooxygenase HmoA